MENPKLFISYSWTNSDHEAWVLRLATDLRESGVDVVLDKWDLREGHDAHAFMEKMVTDPEIRKVILICDKVYAEKADDRAGGVGAEAQIISPEIYSRQDQEKFVAVLKERDEDGRPYLPVYYRPRIWIDLSDPTTYSENFDQLLRWVFDRPLHVKPDLGSPPSFLFETDDGLNLETFSRFRRAIEALKTGRPHAIAAIEDFFKTLAANLKRLRISPNAEPFDDEVVKSIESFIPYRNQVIELVLTVARYRDDDETRRALHRFFESMIPYLSSSGAGSHREWDFDNFKFIAHELFLYVLAILINYERFESTAYLLGTDYYIEGNSDYGSNMIVPFDDAFRHYSEALDHRNQRLGLRRSSLHADLLNERCTGTGITFQQLMQADFVTFMRSNLDKAEHDWPWWPATLLYLRSGVFEIFGKSRSKTYFNRVKVLLNVNSKEEIEPLLQDFESGKRRLPRWDWSSLNPRSLMGFDLIATKP